MPEDKPYTPPRVKFEVPQHINTEPKRMAKKDRMLHPIVADLLAMRYMLGLSQADVVNASGLSMSMIHSLESGASSPTLDKLSAYAHALRTGITITPPTEDVQHEVQAWKESQIPKAAPKPEKEAKPLKDEDKCPETPTDTPVEDFSAGPTNSDVTEDPYKTGVEL